MRTFLGSILLALSVSAADLVFAIGEWPPYTGEMEKDYGTTTKKVQAICDKAGLICEYNFMPWQRAKEVVKAGKAEGTFPWETTTAEELEKAYLVSPAITETEVVIFSLNKDLPDGANKNFSLLNKVNPVGVQGYMYPEQIKKDGIGIHMVTKSELAWKMLEGGRADTYIDDKKVGLAECEQFTPNICKNLIISDPIIVSPMSIIFTRIGNDRQQQAVDKFLDAM